MWRFKYGATYPKSQDLGGKGKIMVKSGLALEWDPFSRTHANKKIAKTESGSKMIHPIFLIFSFVSVFAKFSLFLYLWSLLALFLEQNSLLYSSQMKIKLFIYSFNFSHLLSGSQKHLNCSWRIYVKLLDTEGKVSVRRHNIVWDCSLLGFSSFSL